VARKPQSRVEALLDELCVRYGHCLPPDKQAILLAEPSQHPDAFVDAVLLAEGVDPGLCDKRMRAELTDAVQDWLFDGGLGKGSASGLA
jgi:hypothetical protein